MSSPNRFAALPRLPLAVVAATVSLVIVGRLVVALQPPRVAVPEVVPQAVAEQGGDALAQRTR